MMREYTMDVPGRASRIRFGPFEVDTDSGELRKDGVKVKLQEQPYRALMALLEQPAKIVTREELQRQLWGNQPFGDLDRGLNKVINRLREALGDDADDPRYVETLPQRGYRFVGTIEAAATETPAVEFEPVRARTGVRIWQLASGSILVLVAIMVGGFDLGGWRGRLVSRSPTKIESLAVLPLQNLSGDPEQEYFSDGITDELIGELAQIGPFRVISRTTSMRFKGSKEPLPQIARSLGVDAILEGTVLRAGNRVRISAKLILARDDRHLWAETYERDLGDVLTLQAELARTIARQVTVKVAAQPERDAVKPRPVNPAAHEAYLKGLSLFYRSKERMDKSIEFFDQAIAIDPGYAPPHEGLSMAYVYLGIFGLRPSGEVYPRAEAAALKALALDNGSAGAHLALADVKKGYTWDWAGSEAEYKRALELNPSFALTHSWYADYLTKMRRYDEAILEAKRGRELDPGSSSQTAVLGMILYRARRYDEAIATCRSAIELDSALPNAYWFLALALEQKGEIREAVASMEKATALSKAPHFRAQLGHVYAVAGQRSKAIAVLKELTDLSRQRYLSPVDLAIVHMGLGDRNGAFAALERAYQDRAMRIQELPDPMFDVLHSDPRYAHLMKRIGLPL